MDTEAKPAKLTAADLERDFTRLQELVEQLPEIERQDRLLTRARNARRLRQADQRARSLTAELENYQKTINRALLDAKAAAEQNDKQQEEHNLALLRIYKELHFTRLATQQRAQDEVRELQKRAGISLADPLEDWSLNDADYASLEARINDFRDEYQQLYELLRSHEGLK